MGLKTFFAKIFSKKAGGIIQSIADTADRFIQTPEEKAAFKLEMMKYEMEMTKLTMQAESEYFKDRNSARAMNKSDPLTPRILTIIFTVAYFAITTFMFALVIKMINQDLNDFVVSFISSIFGAFNSIMVQIVSYYFGASKGGDEQGERIAEAFNKAVPQEEE